VETGRAPCTLTVRSPRAALARASVVTRSTAARWGLAGGKVLPVSTGGVPGWCRARRSTAGLTQSATCRGGGAVERRSEVAVNSSGEGTVVIDDGALALHHGEGESEVRWG
jgi:hypothetical protein